MGGTIPAMERVYTAPLLDKLGIRPGMRVALIGVLEDEDEVGDEGPFRARLEERTTDIAEGHPKPESDGVFLAADATDELVALADLRACLRPNGPVAGVPREG